MSYRYLLALFVTLCGCVHQQTVSSQAFARASFPTEQRILAENFLKALYRPSKTRFSITVDPDAREFPTNFSARQRKVELQERLHGFRTAQGNITFAIKSHPTESIYGKFVRSSGTIEYFPAKPDELPDVLLETSPGVIEATIANPRRYQLTSNRFDIRPDEHSFRFVSWASPIVY